MEDPTAEGDIMEEELITVDEPQVPDVEGAERHSLVSGSATVEVVINTDSSVDIIISGKKGGKAGGDWKGVTFNNEAWTNTVRFVDRMTAV